MQDWKFWDWVAYGCLFVSAGIEAGAAGIKQAPEMASKMPEIFKSEWWAFVPLALVVVATMILLFNRLRRRNPESLPDTPTPKHFAQSSGGVGGRGGSGTITGNNGAIFGGRGGEGGLPASGRGGDGGGGTITGDNGVIRGGQGGSAGGYDGRGGKATSPLPSMVNLPKEAWGAGRGGSGANAPEYGRRVALLIDARQEYMEAFPDTRPYIMAGIDQVSPDWINARLESIGETWRVQPGEAGYVLLT